VTASAALLPRLEARRSILVAHLDMLLEAQERGEDIDPVQLDLLASEMLFLADLYRTMNLSAIHADLTEGARAP
jgi:hypothetical protein